MRRPLVFVTVALAAILLNGCASRTTASLVAVDGAPPDADLAPSLDRAVTMASILHSYPWALDQWQANLDLIEALQPGLVGRAALVWGWENLMLRSLYGLRHRTMAIHLVAPDAVLQGCIFEIVTRDLERVRVPADVQHSFGLEPEERTYRWRDMLPTSGEVESVPGGRTEAAVPDITRLETRLWFYHLATIYLDGGLEAIHLGNIARTARYDQDGRWTADLVTRIRAYAAGHARRGWVMIDAHTHGLAHDGRLLFDFHSWPLRPREVGDPAQEDVVLEAGFLDAIYGRSLGGVTPNGRYVRHQRFLVELDNGYAGPSAGGCDLPECVWGHDEITWFARQPAGRRDALLRRFWQRVPELDPAGRFQMPGNRPVQSQLALGCERYLMHPVGAVPCAKGQLDTVLDLWGPPPGR